MISFKSSLTARKNENKTERTVFIIGFRRTEISCVNLYSAE